MVAAVGPAFSDWLSSGTLILVTRSIRVSDRPAAAVMHGPPEELRMAWLLPYSFEVGALNNSSCFDARLQISYSEEPFQLSRWDLCDEGRVRAGRNAEVSKAIAKLKFLLRNQTLFNFRGLFIWWATLIDCLILYPKFWIPFSRYFGRQSSHCVSS